MVAIPERIYAHFMRGDVARGRFGIIATVKKMVSSCVSNVSSCCRHETIQVGNAESPPPAFLKTVSDQSFTILAWERWHDALGSGAVAPMTWETVRNSGFFLMAPAA